MLSAFLLDVEVFDLIRGAIGCDNIEEFSEAVLLQVLLCEILQVTFGEAYLCLYADSLLISNDFNRLAEVPSSACYLDACSEELCEVVGVEDLILNGFGAIDCKGV